MEVKLMSADERFITLANELGYDIYAENILDDYCSPVLRRHDEVYASGLLPLLGNMLIFPGRVGADLSAAEGHQAAKITAVHGLALILQTIGSLDRIKALARVTVYIRSTENFTELFEVANGASEIFRNVLGELGKHTRTTIGVYQLPENAAVQLDIVASIDGNARLL